MFAVALTSQNDWLLGGTLVGPVGPVSPGSSITIPVIRAHAGGLHPRPERPARVPGHGHRPAARDHGTVRDRARPASPAQLAVERSAPTASSFSLLGSNPFRGGTRFSYTIPQRTPVRIEVFSVTGQRVRTLVDEVKEAGAYSASLSLSERGARNLRAGIYLVRLSAGEASRAIRVVGFQ